jgi:predicted nucleic acid-binding protein
LRAVSNSSPLIALEQIGKLDLLRELFSAVIIPPAVASETSPTVKLPPWITVDRLRWRLDPRTIRPSLGLGESEAISLSLELRPGRIILDDEPARRLALSLGLQVTGTLGIILAAKRRGLLRNVKTEMDSLLATGFFIGAELYNKILQLAGESSQTD